MKPKTTWFLIADAGRAFVYASTGWDRGLEPVTDSPMEGDNRPTRAVGTERPGRVHESADTARHALAPRVDWHRDNKRRFAAEVAEFLEDANQRDRFDRLVVVAPPAALGDLRAALSDAVRSRIVGELAKDLTKLPAADLPAHLEKLAPL